MRTKITVPELEGEDKHLLIHFLYNLEQRGMIWSQMETSPDGSRMDRAWYGYEESVIE